MKDSFPRVTLLGLPSSLQPCLASWLPLPRQGEIHIVTRAATVPTHLLVPSWRTSMVYMLCVIIAQGRVEFSVSQSTTEHLGTSANHNRSTYRIWNLITNGAQRNLYFLTRYCNLAAAISHCWVICFAFILCRTEQFRAPSSIFSSSAYLRGSNSQRGDDRYWKKEER